MNKTYAPSPMFDFRLVSILQRGSEYSKTIHYSFSHFSTIAVIPLCCATKQTHLNYVMEANFPTLGPRIQKLERVHWLETRLIKKTLVHFTSSLWNADASKLTSSWLHFFFHSARARLRRHACRLLEGAGHLPTKTRCVFRVCRKILEQIAGASSHAVQRMS